VLEPFILRNLPDLIGLGIVWLVLAAGTLWILSVPGARWPGRRCAMILLVAAGTCLMATFAFFLRFARVMRHFPPWWFGWGRGLMLAWVMFTMLFVVAYMIAHYLPRERPDYSPARRNFLRAAKVAVFAAPAAVVGYGVFVERRKLELREQNVVIPDLHPDLEGLRIVQLSDIHLSPFLSVKELDYAIGLANETRAHLALVTGDLISTEVDPVDLCMNRLLGVRADAGIYGCLGNHEIYARCEDYVEQQGERLGMHFLRKRAVPLRFGNGVMNLAGVDYQRMHTPYLYGAQKLVQPGALNVLMSHNPDVFPVAARQGWDFTISGHTHGGQVRVEILHANLNIARFFTPYIDGLYREGAKSIFVSRGIGTIGAPIRLECPPEVTLLRLCRT
jgi:uncharacterized protein